MDVLVDPALSCRVHDVSLDRRTVGQGLGTGPRTEVISEGVHVGIRADARIAKQIPGTAHRFAPFDNGDPLAWAFTAQMARCPDPGDSRADNQNIKVLALHEDHLS